MRSRMLFGVHGIQSTVLRLRLMVGSADHHVHDTEMLVDMLRVYKVSRKVLNRYESNIKLKEQLVRKSEASRLKK